MLGYDTLQGAWNEMERDWSAVPWQSVSQSTTGVRKFILNRPLVQLTRVESCDPSTGVIRQMGTTFQCSLPKVLYGNNVRELPLDDVPAALDCLHELIKQDVPDCPHPSLMTPRRIDATGNRHLGSEKKVRAALNACRSYQLGRTKPFIGQDRTVNWPGKSGGHRSKVYSKLYDCIRLKADEELIAQAEGVLRVESGAVGLKSIRSDMAKALALAEYSGDLTVGTALACPGLSAAILGPLNGIVDAVLESEVMTLNISEFMQRFIDAGYSPVKAYSAVGYAQAVKESGWENLMLTRQGIHKLKKEFKAAGIDPLELELGPLMVRVAKPYAASSRQMARLEKQQAVEDETSAVVVPAVTSS